MREELPGRPCSVAAALNLIGEKWALLAVREIAFGNKRFDVIARNTGAPRDRLAARLRALEAGRRAGPPPVQRAPAALRVRLTEAGQELRGVLTALRAGATSGWSIPRRPDRRRVRGMSSTRRSSAVTAAPR